MISYLIVAWFGSVFLELLNVYVNIVASSFILIEQINAPKFYLVILFFVIIITSFLTLEVEVKNIGQKGPKTANLTFLHLKVYLRKVRLMGISFKILHQCHQFASRLQTTEA